MNGKRVDRDETRLRGRTRRSMAASGVLHALLFAWLVLQPVAAPGGTPITEFAYLDADDVGEPGWGEPAAGGAAGPMRAAPRPAVVAEEGIGTSVADVRFPRQEEEGEVEVHPRTDAAFADRLAARLSAMPRESSRPVAASVATVNVPGLWGASGGSGGGVGAGTGTGAGSGAVALKRGGGGAGGGTGTGFGLGSGSGGSLPRRALVPVAPAERAAAPAEPKLAGGGGSVRTLAGASLIGPLADRPIVSYVAASYPEWAKREGVEGSVRLYFVVSTDGTVKESIVVEKTAGFEDFDDSAGLALRAWRFAPLGPGQIGEQWGRITFHFRLRETG
jgi:TonB family protein